MMDRLRYEIFYRLWTVWHCRLRQFPPFMVHVPEKVYGMIDGRKLAEKAHYRDWACCRHESRPWWHLCCNGDAGGWRTNVCNYLEGNWRSTDYYNREDDHPCETS